MKKQFCDERDGKKYVYVVIGEQTWMAENLNYNASGSKCYNNLESNCNTYGRLYDWSTAMGFSSSCNSSSCSSQIQTKHRGVCPAGWHLPSNAEWDALETAVGGYSTAGTKLKVASGWNSNGNGTDDYGFSALPGGSGYSVGSFVFVGNSGGWWSAAEDNASIAYLRGILDGSNVFESYGNKSDLYSVRCLQDCSTNDNTSTHYCSNGTMKAYGSVTYQGQTYKTVVIGTQTWMAENLNYNASGSKCYSNSESNCDTYGRLYDWSTAMGFSSSCNSSSCSSQIQTKHRGVCPARWHIPSDAEWTTLTDYVGYNAGTKLKSVSGWSSTSGTDGYGFSALPGGDGYSDGSFSSVGYGYWWSATENNASFAYSRYMNYDFSDVGRSDYLKSILYSVRCVQD
jgi:uncharacterized protein (TIGR02145 family)